ncbi:MAG: ribosomal protein S18-alanine N-acetyltransferase [Clostridiales bacterium]|nr:ribosomal protein S18-alanine N-acetyltransferase [Clostridiales bacterium]
MIAIEYMTEQDCKEVQALLQQCFSVPWSESSIMDMFRTDGYVNLVARQETTIVGYIGIKSVLDEADIINVAVSPAWRRKGIGEKLLERLLELAQRRKITRIFLEVRVSNLAAITLYENA